MSDTWADGTRDPMRCCCAAARSFCTPNDCAMNKEEAVMTVSKHSIPDRIAAAAKEIAAPASDAQRYYDTLRKIARQYMTAEQCGLRCRSHGLEPEEMLAMSYENIQQEAERVIKGKRRPNS